MAWFVLLLSAVFEAVWATALGASDGFSHLRPTLVFVVFLTLSQLGLALAMRVIPLGTAYAVWTGVGAALTVAWSMATGAESADPLKIAFLVGIVGCVIGLKLLPSGPQTRRAAPVGTDEVGVDDPDGLHEGER